MASVNLKTLSGNRIEVQFDGFRVGLVQSVSMNDDYSPEPASGIGDLHVQEHVPTMARHSLSVSTMVLFTNNLRDLGIAAENGNEVLVGKVFDIVAFSKDDGAELRKYVGCSYASGSVDIAKHAIIVSNAQFLALDVTGSGV
ncbi:MAG: hypothetical protein ACU843_12860 [Gammaproteobacteria bacterium]